MLGLYFRHVQVRNGCEKLTNASDGKQGRKVQRQTERCMRGWRGGEEAQETQKIEAHMKEILEGKSPLSNSETPGMRQGLSVSVCTYMYIHIL